MNRNLLLALAAVMAAGILATGCAKPSGEPAGKTEIGKPGKKITICMLPKKKGIPYFSSCANGAKKAAEELGNVEFIYDGPTDGSPEKAAAMIEKWVLKRVDVICVSPNDPDVLAPAMKAAREKGVKVITFDSDGKPDSRELFVNQATAEQIGNALVDTLIDDIGGKNATGQVAIVTATLTAANQNIWMNYMKTRIKNNYPKIDLVAVKPSNEDQKLAFQVSQDLLKAYPDLKGIWGISSVSFPGAAEAIKQAGKSGKVQVTGLATPNDMKTYVKEGTVRSVVLWNTEDLGGLTVKAAYALATGKWDPKAKEFDAGTLGKKKIVGDNLLLGDILVFRKDNIDKYNF